MKFTFSFNGFSASNDKVNVNLDGIDVTYEVTPAEFADIMANNREILKSLPGLINQFKDVIAEVNGDKKE